MIGQRHADILSQAGIECPMTSFKEWAEKYDWSTILEGVKTA